MNSTESGTIPQYINIKSSEQISHFGRKIAVTPEKSVRIVDLLSRVRKSTGSSQNLDTLLRDLSKMKKYAGRRSSFYHLQIVFIVGMLSRHPEMKV